VSNQFLRLVLLVARRDYLRTVRRRGFLLATLLLPASMALLFVVSSAASIGAASGGNQPGQILLVNESSVALYPDAGLTPDVTVLPRAAAEAELANGSATSYFVVPATWPAQAQVSLIEAASANTGRSLETLTRQEAQQSEVELLLRVSLLRDAGLPDATLGQLLTPVTFDSVTTSGEPVSDAAVAANFIVPYVFTLIFVLSIFITSGYLLQSVTEEKENRVVEIVLSSIPALPLMAGKVLGLGAAGLTQVAIWLGTALLAMPLINQQLQVHVSLEPGTLALAVVVFCLGYLAYGAIFAALGALASGAREAQQYSSFFGFFAVVPLILTPIFLSDPNSIVVWVLALIPLTAPAAILEVLSTGAPPVLMIGLSLVVQVLFVAVAIVAAGRVFRATVLLYGTRPTLGRIVAAVTARA
jgi:ABC-2 type transport system permease protein